MKTIHLIASFILNISLGTVSCWALTNKDPIDQELKIIPNDSGEYIIRKNYDLHGNTITMPAASRLIFHGGSINNGTIILSDGCTVIGNGTHLKAHSTIDGKQLGHQSLLMAESADSILIENIVLEGNYKESMGHLNPWSDKSSSSQSLLFLKDCRHVRIEGLTVSNFYNSMSTHHASWDLTYKSNWTPFPVNIYGCEDVQILNCKHAKSCGGAWNIMKSRHVSIQGFSCKQRYATSILSVIYCDDVKINNCHIEVKESLGNLINIVARNYVVEHCYIHGGDLDFGNEHANVNLDLDEDGIVGDNKKYVISGAVVKDNLLINASITNNTAEQASINCPIDDIVISHNSILIDVSSQESLRAINLGSYGGINLCEIVDNAIQYKGKYNKRYAANNDYRYIPIVVYRNNYPVNKLQIRGNTITNRAKWDKNKTNTLEMTKTLGAAILVDIKSGDITIEENNINTLYGITINERSSVKVKQVNNIFKPK